MFLGDFCKLNKTSSDGICLGERPRGFCDVGFCCCFTSRVVPWLLFVTLLLRGFYVTALSQVLRF